MNTLDDQTLGLIASHESIVARIAELTDARDHVRAAIIENLGDDEQGINPTTGKVVVRNVIVRRFDMNAARDYLDDAAVAEATVHSLDPKRVKTHLTGEQLDACMIPTDSRRFTVVAP